MNININELVAKPSEEQLEWFLLNENNLSPETWATLRLSKQVSSILVEHIKDSIIQMAEYTEQGIMDFNEFLTSYESCVKELLIKKEETKEFHE